MSLIPPRHRLNRAQSIQGSVWKYMLDVWRACLFFLLQKQNSFIVHMSAWKYFRVMGGERKKNSLTYFGWSVKSFPRQNVCESINKNTFGVFASWHLRCLHFLFKSWGLIMGCNDCLLVPFYFEKLSDLHWAGFTRCALNDYYSVEEQLWIYEFVTLIA